MRTYEINLCCPVCGDYEFTWDGLKETWTCEECSWEGTADEMIPHHFEARGE